MKNSHTAGLWNYRFRPDWDRIRNKKCSASSIRGGADGTETGARNHDDLFLLPDFRTGSFSGARSTQRNPRTGKPGDADLLPESALVLDGDTKGLELQLES